MVVTECSEDEFTALKQGENCPYYAAMAAKERGDLLAAAPAQTFHCNCPPSMVVTECSEDEFTALKQGENCPYYAAIAAKEREAALVLAGGDTDEHGCKPSTGAAWCPQTGACVLPGEHCPGGTEQCQQICK